MGEEMLISDMILCGPDGKSFKWDGLGTATINIDREEDEQESEFIAALKNNQTIECEIEGHISRYGRLILLLGHKRLIRRALRWDERLRKLERKHDCKIDNRLGAAIEMARCASNNKPYKNRKVFYLIDLIPAYED